MDGKGPGMVVMGEATVPAIPLSKLVEGNWEEREGRLKSGDIWV